MSNWLKELRELNGLNMSKQLPAPFNDLTFLTLLTI